MLRALHISDEVVLRQGPRDFGGCLLFLMLERKLVVQLLRGSADQSQKLLSGLAPECLVLGCFLQKLIGF